MEARFDFHMHPSQSYLQDKIIILTHFTLMSHGSVCIVQKIDFEDRILVVTVKTSGKMVLEIRLCVSVRLDVDRSVPLAGHAP